MYHSKNTKKKILSSFPNEFLSPVFRSYFRRLEGFSIPGIFSSVAPTINNASISRKPLCIFTEAKTKNNPDQPRIRPDALFRIE